VTDKPCPCGKPWPDLNQYDPQQVRFVETQVQTLGEYVPVTVEHSTYLVSRYHIAFHGITGQQLLAGKSGFERIDSRYADAKNATLLLREVEEALERGTKHYAVDGRPLLTVEAICEALLADGKIEFEPKKQPS
jgi:hypothetical protein